MRGANRTIEYTFDLYIHIYVYASLGAVHSNGTDYICARLIDSSSQMGLFNYSVYIQRLLNGKQNGS